MAYLGVVVRTDMKTLTSTSKVVIRRENLFDNHISTIPVRIGAMYPYMMSCLPCSILGWGDEETGP